MDEYLTAEELSVRTGLSLTYIYDLTKKLGVRRDLSVSPHLYDYIDFYEKYYKSRKHHIRDDDANYKSRRTMALELGVSEQSIIYALRKYGVKPVAKVGNENYYLRKDLSPIYVKFSRYKYKKFVRCNICGVQLRLSELQSISVSVCESCRSKLSTVKSFTDGAWVSERAPRSIGDIIKELYG